MHKYSTYIIITYKYIHIGFILWDREGCLPLLGNCLPLWIVHTFKVWTDIIIIHNGIV